MRVLLVNELGGGLGHLIPLMAVATALGPAWNRRIVVPDPAKARSLVAKHVHPGIAVDRSPPWLAASVQGAEQSPATYSFADALHSVGLGDARAWRSVIKFWSDLFETVRPDLIISDAAPGVRLAAAGRVPVVTIGNGYSVPPAGHLLPSLVSVRPDVPPAVRQREALILAAANEVQAERDGPTLDHVADLFNGDATFVGTHPLLDPYRAHRTGPTWWPCAVPLPLARSPSHDARALLFAYLHDGHPALEAVLSLLAQIGHDRSVSCADGPAMLTPHVYVLHGDPRRIAKQCGPAVIVHERLVDVAGLLSRTSVVIHHCGTGMSHEALAGGTAQLLLPLNLEQVLTSQSLRSLGIGYVIPPVSGAEALQSYSVQLRNGVDHLLRPKVQDEAARKANELRTTNFGDTLATIVTTCQRLVGAPAR